MTIATFKQSSLSRISSIILFFTAAVILSSCQDDTPHILVFTKTAGFYHESIPVGIAALQKLGAENGFKVDTTKDASNFNDDQLKKYKTMPAFMCSLNSMNKPMKVVRMVNVIQSPGIMNMTEVVLFIRVAVTPTNPTVSLCF